MMRRHFFSTTAKRKNLYALLGVARHASCEEIKTAFRAKAVLHHPDTSDAASPSSEYFRGLLEAYRVLKDDSSRRQYDADYFEERASATSTASMYSSPTSARSGFASAAAARSSPQPTAARSAASASARPKYNVDAWERGHELGRYRRSGAGSGARSASVRSDAARRAETFSSGWMDVEPPLPTQQEFYRTIAHKLKKSS